eukprot:6309413-Amphidinium_carterae.1
MSVDPREAEQAATSASKFPRTPSPNLIGVPPQAITPKRQHALDNHHAICRTHELTQNPNREVVQRIGERWVQIGL